MPGLPHATGFEAEPIFIPGRIDGQSHEGLTANFAQVGGGFTRIVGFESIRTRPVFGPLMLRL